ncbi:TlpA disulfide reductase family protein [Chitinophaga lutea]|nr:TlpA disulfide reductase family protein [Chitinophaga lutea]
MKKLLTVLMLAGCIAGASAQEYTIRGKVSPALNGNTIHLDKRTAAGAFRVASTTISNGAFTFKGKTAEPFAAALSFRSKQKNGAGYRLFFIDKGEQIVFEQRENNTSRNMFGDALISGSAVSKQWDELAALRQPVEDSMKIIDGQLVKLFGIKNEVTDELWRKQAALQQKMKRVTDEFISRHPDYFVSLYEFRAGLNKPEDPAAALGLFKRFSPELQASSLGKATLGAIGNATKLVKGVPAPVFSAVNPQGQQVNLGSFKGKYVLVDFWASWCHPCRKEFPHLIKAYSRFKNRNFEILGVSLDKDLAAWKAAIAKDKISWPQVVDPGGLKIGKPIYLITSIPQNYLLDPSGNIIGINLRGEAVEKELEKVL